MSIPHSFDPMGTATAEPPLPAGYTRLLYIESPNNGGSDTSNVTHAITSGVKATTADRWELDVAWLAPQIERSMYNGHLSFGGASRAAVNYYSSGKCITIQYANETPGVPNSGAVEFAKNTFAFGQRYYCVLDLANKRASVNGETHAVGYDSAAFDMSRAGNFYFFARQQEKADGSQSPNYQSRQRMYGAKIFRNGALLRHWVPAQRQTDGTNGLFEVQSRQFFANYYAQNFIAGPII